MTRTRSTPVAAPHSLASITSILNEQLAALAAAVDDLVEGIARATVRADAAEARVEGLVALGGIGGHGTKPIAPALPLRLPTGRGQGGLPGGDWAQ